MYRNYSELGSGASQNQDQYEVPEIIDHRHKQQIVASNAFVCVDIYADWCGPCKQTAPNYGILAVKYNSPGMIAIVKQNFDKLDQSERPKIGGIPTFQFFLNGNLVDEFVGADIPKIEEKIIQYTRNGKVEFQDGPQFNRNSIRQSKMTPHLEEHQGMPYQAGGSPYQSFVRNPPQNQPPPGFMVPPPINSNFQVSYKQ